MSDEMKCGCEATVRKSESLGDLYAESDASACRFQDLQRKVDEAVGKIRERITQLKMELRACLPEDASEYEDQLFALRFALRALGVEEDQDASQTKENS